MHLFNSAFNVSVLIAKRKLDGMTIITQMMKKEIATRFDVDPDWIGVWTSGVSTSLFRNENHVHDGRELREKLGLTSKFIIFYHGGFSESRGLMDCINAMVIVKDRYPDVVLFLLGTGSVQTVSDMRKAIADNKIQDRVILHEAVEYADVPKYIAMGDVGIVPLPDLPQWRNQSPLKLLEYLAMKKVVILTNIPAHREIIGNSNCGIYMPSISDTEITKAIEFAYNNREKLEGWGVSGRTIVEKKYTWTRIAENLESYLRGVEKGTRAKTL